jgi:hypothetical protein
VASIAHQALRVREWHRLSSSLGTKGERLFDWARLPVVQAGSVDGCHWLLMRRCLDDPNELAYYLVWAPPETPLSTMVQAVGARWQIEIVQPQMTKTDLFAARSGGDHITDLHLPVSHDDAINQQFDQVPFLLKRRLSQSLLDASTKRFH